MVQRVLCYAVTYPACASECGAKPVHNRAGAPGFLSLARYGSAAQGLVALPRGRSAPDPQLRDAHAAPSVSRGAVLTGCYSFVNIAPFRICTVTGLKPGR